MHDVRRMDDSDLKKADDRIRVLRRSIPTLTEAAEKGRHTLTDLQAQLADARDGLAEGTTTAAQLADVKQRVETHRSGLAEVEGAERAAKQEIVDLTSAIAVERDARAIARDEEGAAELRARRKGITEAVATALHRIRFTLASVADLEAERARLYPRARPIEPTTLGAIAKAWEAGFDHPNAAFRDQVRTGQRRNEVIALLKAVLFGARFAGSPGEELRAYQDLFLLDDWR